MPLSKLLLDDLQGQLLLLDPPRGLFQQLQLSHHQQAMAGETLSGEITKVNSSELLSHKPGVVQNSLSIEQILEALPQFEDVDTVFLGDLAATAKVFTPAEPIESADSTEPGEAGQSRSYNIAAITRLLSYCRDRVRSRVFICLQPDPEGYQLPGELLFSLGYIKLPTATLRQTEEHESVSEQAETTGIQAFQQIYYFSLQSYKTQPDWLNSRFWANPERWNLPN